MAILGSFTACNGIMILLSSQPFQLARTNVLQHVQGVTVNQSAIDLSVLTNHSIHWTA